jgi:Kef-type K+ transport system membrane component KefB
MAHAPLLLQLVVILGCARLLGFMLRWFGQPPVVGEMAAGFVLGPIVLGAFAPEWHAYIFDAENLPALAGLSEVGLVLFMFIIGAELRVPTGVRAQLKAAASVGFGSVLVPLALGLAISPWLYPTLAPAGVGYWSFAFFVGAALAITAFPVLARILKDRALTQSELGQLALSSAALIDVFAWVMLACVVVAVGAQSDWSRLGRLLSGSALLLLAVFGLLRPLFARLIGRYAQDGRPEGTLLASLLIGTFACAFATNLLGLHAVFGAFLFGACLPRDDRLLKTLIERIEHVAVLALMPIFFALTGLNTTPAAFVGADGTALALILVAAVVGKLIGGAAGARISGRDWRQSLSVGALMNARGLMELIVIKVGLDAGIIGKPLFTMLMVMAIVTTLMTGPLLSWFAGRDAAGAGAAPARSPS